MKKRLVQSITNNNQTYGQVSSPVDLMKAQDFLHERLDQTTQDFLVTRQKGARGVDTQGFAYELSDGNAFRVTIKLPGRIYNQAGKQFEAESDAVLQVATADSQYPRLDIICAVLGENQDANVALIPFVRLRTNTEWTNGVAPYPPTNFNQATEKHNTATVVLKTGTAAQNATLPTLQANEVPLYILTIAPNAARIRPEDIIDLRQQIRTLRDVGDAVDSASQQLTGLTRRVEAVEDFASHPIDLGPVYGRIRSLGDVLGAIQNQVNALKTELPEVRVLNSNDVRYAQTDPRSAKIVSAGNLDNTTPVVDIELGAKILFGDAEIILRPEQFQDTSVNARFALVAPTAANEKIETNLTLQNVEQIAADGFVDFVQKQSSFSASRSRPAVAARNKQSIEIFGGLAANNDDFLGDWFTYDVDNDTLTARNFTGTTPPNSDRPAMFPLGNGTDVLLGCGNSANQTPRWFRLNANTGNCTEITSATKPVGLQFIGDLIAANKVFLIAVRKVNDAYTPEFWEYNGATGAFTQLGVTGNIPVCFLDYFSGCVLQNGLFALTEFTPGVSQSGKTSVFNYASLEWRLINIAAPFGDGVERQASISQFKMANVNGRPLLVGGYLKQDTDATKAKVWELRHGTVNADTGDYGLRWQQWNATFAPIRDCGFAATLGADNLPTGRAVQFGGTGKYNDAKTQIFASVQGGIIATTLNGQPAITLADGSSFAQIIIERHLAAWQIADYYASILGSYNESNLKVEVSFDDGVNFHAVTPNKIFPVADSTAPGKRQIKITLFNLQTSKPVLAKLTEIFDQNTGQLPTRIVLRYTAPTVTKALYVDRTGAITLSATIAPSTSDKAILHKVTPNGTSAPTVKNYINRRRARVRYTKTATADATTTQFDNELAVPVSFVDARGAAANDKIIYQLAIPAVGFDQIVTVTGVEENDDWTVELSA